MKAFGSHIFVFCEGECYDILGSGGIKSPEAGGQLAEIPSSEIKIKFPLSLHCMKVQEPTRGFAPQIKKNTSFPISFVPISSGLYKRVNGYPLRPLYP